MNPEDFIIANLVKAWTKKNPDLDVLTFVDIDADGNFVDEKRSYRQLWENGQRLAAWLKTQGLRKGDTFGMVMMNHPEFVDLMVASSILGTIFVPIDPRIKGDKLQYMLAFSECKGAVVATYAAESVHSAWGAAGSDDHWVLPLHGDESVASILAGPRPDVELPIANTDPNAPMQLLFTSGTTGDPKAIMTTHIRLAAVPVIADIMGLAEGDRPYTGLSLTHANAQLITLGACLVLGLRGVFSRKFTKSRLWDLSREYGCTWFNLLGGMTNAIFAEPQKENDADNPVRKVLSAGMPAAIWKDFEQRFDLELTEFYGAAEGGLTFNPAGIGPAGSCGKPPPSLELKIFDDNGNECAAGEPGEICFRNADGSSPVVRYFKNPEASEQKTHGGWLRMGDIGHVDENGWLFFHYRKGGGIRRNGDFINPAFVEKALAENAMVDDVFVYGVALPGMAPGEKEVVAAVVANPDLEFDANAVFDSCKSQLAASFMPTFLQVVKDIPKTVSEKPQERFLLEDFSVDAANVHRIAHRH
ncbi:AMP-binding protein [Pseudohalioglobus lutimaris]|uniref:ATP-dependent acyl-CoA ligase n=1 Tax=Pseudohalioglobus lutimaris TaxID=1737061 RepID=A0A2N5X086_9GAMM|nr:AMP-binding protein [Pseudohalioglobus lutimaris]PLW67870.1 ATP-dependent acyl-CoA ligase [Pseudohalioglobus lutimaris]